MMGKEDLKISEEDLKRVGLPKAKKAEEEDPRAKETQDLNAVLSEIKHKLIVCSGKGGVGKSTVSVNLAMTLAAQGKSVGILDIDITGPNIPKMLHIEDARPEVEPGQNRFYPVNGPLNVKIMSMAFLLETPDTPVIWRGPLKMSALRQFIKDGYWGKLDYLVIDLPPGTGDETLDIMQLVDGHVIVVTTPQDVATLDAGKTITMSRTMKRPILGVIENMSGFTVKCPHCDKEETYNLFGNGGGEQMALSMKTPFLGKIPIELSVREQGDTGIPIVIKYPESASAQAFEAIVKNIRDQLEPLKK
jgi:Mrp family chromosome partitioning ATPase